MSAAISLSRDTVERYREPTFVALILVGLLVFSLGAAFLVLGLAVNTEPPSPYVSPTDKQLMIGLSLVTVVVGGALIRAGTRLIGW